MSLRRSLLQVLIGFAIGIAVGSGCALLWEIMSRDRAAEYPEYHAYLSVEVWQRLLILGACIGTTAAFVHSRTRRSFTLSRVLTIVAFSAVVVAICSLPFQPVGKQVKAPEYLWYAVGGTILGGVIVLVIDRFDGSRRRAPK